MKILLKTVSGHIPIVLLFAGLGSPVYAQQSALLVGISTREAPGVAEFVEQRNQTFLIESDGKTAKLVVTLPDIIVPHGRDFWRVGMVTNCNAPGDQAEAAALGRSDAGQTAKDSSFGETLYVNPIEVRPKVPALRKDPSHSCDLNPCDFRNETIWFVNSRFVSTDFSQGKSEACEPRGFSWYGETHVRRLGETAPVSFKELTGDDGWEAYNFAMREASYKLQEDGTNCEVFSDHSEVSEDTNWTLRRERGQWIALLRWQIGSAACEYVDDIDIALPETLTGYDTLRPTWSILEQKIKNLKDAFTSPAGNLLLARTETSVAVYAMSVGKVGRKLLELPAGRIVMTQWTAGKWVDQWEKQLSNWERRGLPSLVVQPEQSPRP